MADIPVHPSRPASPPVLPTFQAMSMDALLDRYALGVENFDRRAFELNDAELDTAFFPEAQVGRWPARVLLGHVADAELAQVHRIRRTVAEQNPVLAVWDEHAFIEAGLYGTPANGSSYPAAAFIAVVHTLRKWNAEWMKTLDAKAFQRVALHPERGEQTISFMVAYLTWHLEHHAWYMNRKIDLLLSKR